MPTTLIRCPKCGWEPDESCRWMCEVCDTRWNTFDTHGSYAYNEENRDKVL